MEQTSKRLARDPDSNLKAIGWEDSEHAADGPLHRFLGSLGGALPYDAGVQRLNLLQHLRQHVEFLVEFPSSGRHIVIPGTGILFPETPAHDRNQAIPDQVRIPPTTPPVDSRLGGYQSQFQAGQVAVC